MIETDLYAELQISCCQVIFRVSGRVAHFREEIPGKEITTGISTIKGIKIAESKFTLSYAIPDAVDLGLSVKWASF